jgi:hypothetical protein
MRSARPSCSREGRGSASLAVQSFRAEWELFVVGETFRKSTRGILPNIGGTDRK